MQIYHRTTFVWHTIRECVRVYAAWNGTTIHQNIFLTSIQVVNAIILFIRRSHWINFYRMNPPIEQEMHSTGNIPKSNSSFRSPRMSTIFFLLNSILNHSRAYWLTSWPWYLHISRDESCKQHHTKAGKPKVSQSARFRFLYEKRMKIKEILLEKIHRKTDGVVFTSEIQ